MPIAVGELKVPWVEDHVPSRQLAKEDRFRHLLGQIASYLKDLGLSYGFYTTVEETVFLQVDDAPGGHQSVLKYSPIISRKDTYHPGQSVTLRQCFYFLGGHGGTKPSPYHGGESP
ncbi:uncharacterized protein BO80DRAFT_441093 [Aspergillus ibericus CBS 121593]|uniref:Uncharacterized protein n=1 Tax=Aspergillus ibericus CBS 121593 TaxID=1448316 RepID=A0A395HCI3_9EURO|nr:hypothetical protein BO80DRAFT_441093 [Aspergillus ibericus CBS 121593]RAL05512.1 hypothetical protein BO80DRAFT_441093 [Aspergillus ibericus CBS 121593]